MNAKESIRHNCIVSLALDSVMLIFLLFWMKFSGAGLKSSRGGQQLERGAPLLHKILNSEYDL